MEAALERGVAEHGPFDTLVHAVGPLVVKRFANASLEDYRDRAGRESAQRRAGRAGDVACHARGSFRAHDLLRDARLRARRVPFRGFSLYQSAKSALVAFARCLAVEEAPHGITVNVVSPGDIREKTLDRAHALERAARNPRGRPGSYEDVADVVRFLIAPQRDFITGQVIEVTGGLQTAAE